MAALVKGKARKRRTQDDYRRRFEILFSTTRRVSGGESLDEILDALVELTSHEPGKLGGTNTLKLLRVGPGGSPEGMANL